MEPSCSLRRSPTSSARKRSRTEPRIAPRFRSCTRCKTRSQSATPARPPARSRDGVLVEAEDRGKELAGVAARRLGHLLGRALGDDLAAGVTALGAEVVLDHQHGVATLDEP